MKTSLFLIYAWSTTLAFLLFIFWLAGVEEFVSEPETSSEAVVRTIGIMLVFSSLYVLVFRSVVLTLKSSVDRLSKWRSRRETMEDAEFVLIIETLITLLVICISLIAAVIFKWIQAANGLNSEKTEISDILISLISIMLSAIVIYTVPVVGELEAAIIHSIRDWMNLDKKKASKN